MKIRYLLILTNAKKVPSKSKYTFKLNMGNAQRVLTDVLANPDTEEELRSKCADIKEPHLQAWINALLGGDIPTNFTYQDICDYLTRATDNALFCLIPIWTLQFTNVQSAATCMIKTWPEWTDAQARDPDFLRAVRLMLPLFKPGEPIGICLPEYISALSPVPS